MKLPYMSKSELIIEDNKPLGAASIIDEEALHIKAGNKEYVFPYRHIKSIENINYKIHINYNNKNFIIKDLGYNFEDYLSCLIACYNEQILKDLLMEEKLVFEVSGEWANNEEFVEAKFRLYENALVVIPWNHELIRIPYCFIKSFNINNYTIEIVDYFKKSYKIYRLGRQHDPFIREYKKCIEEMYKRTNDILKNIITDIKSEEIKKISEIMPDGMGIPLYKISELSETVKNGIEKYIENTNVNSEYNYLKNISDPGEICVGVKRGLMGDLSGEMLWYMIPVYKNEKYKKVVAIEFIQDGDAGGATYIYDMNECNTKEEWNMLLNEINYALISINFRREPIYITDDSLNLSKNEGYKIAVNRLPSLQKLRKLFIGRVIHKDYESWKKNIDSLISKK